MPQLGETVDEGTVAAWHKQVGDRVETDEILLDVETDKVSMEIPSPGAGVLKQILVDAGRTVGVGTVLAVIENAAATTSAESAAAGADEQPQPAPQPAIADTQAAAAEAPAAPWPPTQPARPTVEPPADGAPAGHGSAPAEPAAAAAAATPVEPSTAVPRDGNLRLSPAVRRLAAQHRLELQAVPGSGRDGRITRRDVTTFLASRSPETQPSATSATAARFGSTDATAQPAAQPDLRASAAATTLETGHRAESPAAAKAETPAGGLKPFSRIRRLTAEHMVRSKTTSPHVLQAVEVDFHRVDVARHAVREAWRGQHGFSLTYLPFIAHAVCRALRDFPDVNSSVQGDALLLHEHVNLAIAVDLGAEGLVAPVIKSAEQLSVTQLAQAIYDLSKRARDNRLRPDDLSGGTYTLSNSGTFGTLITAPVINQPQVAILSTDGVRKKPVIIEHADGDSIAIRPIGILAHSFDHRAIDGAYSAAYLDRVRKLLERGDWSVDV